MGTIFARVSRDGVAVHVFHGLEVSVSECVMKKLEVILLVTKTRRDVECPMDEFPPLLVDEVYKIVQNYRSVPVLMLDGFFSK